MEYIEINGRRIGKKYPPLVIAEIGINHNGSLKVAKEMVYAAYRAGAEIIKHQTHIVDDEMSKESKKVIPCNANVSIYEIMKKSALSFEDEKELKEYVESKNMIFHSSELILKELCKKSFWNNDVQKIFYDLNLKNIR